MVMNDFLRNLRSSNKKDTPPPRKNLDSQYYSQSERRNIMDRRTKTNSTAGPSGSGGSGSASMDSMVKQMGEILPLVLDNTSLLAEQVEKLAAISEMVAESTVRKNNAVADFFDSLGEILASPPQSGMQGSVDPMSPMGPTKATASYASGTHYTKDDILSIIQNMRDQGGTFAVIAEYLREKGIPTFSGRGEWHAQTIHRLCK